MDELYGLLCDGVVMNPDEGFLDGVARAAAVDVAALEELRSMAERAESPPPPPVRKYLEQVCAFLREMLDVAAAAPRLSPATRPQD